MGVRRKAAYNLTITILLIGVLVSAVKIEPVWTEGSIGLERAPMQQKASTLSEGPPIEWNKTYGGTGDDLANSLDSLVQTSDGGYALAGTTTSFGVTGKDVLLVKTDANGNMQWNKTYGGAGEDYGRSVIQSIDGGYLFMGSTNSSGAGGNDFWLVKTDANGNMQWNKTYGGAEDELTSSVVQTSDGGYAISGSTKSYGAGGYDFWLVKFAPEIQYTLTITTTSGGTTNPAPGTYTYLSGTQVSVTAIQNTGYIFDHWELDGINIGSTNPVTVTMDSNHNLKAYFTQVPYDVTIKAHCYTEGVDINVPIIMDGNPTGYYTPHTFTGLTRTHTFTVPPGDPNWHRFQQWSTGATSTTITVIQGGTYTAFYQAGVGGYVIPVDKIGLLAPYIGLASTTIIALTATIVYVKRFKHKKQKQ